MLMDFAVFGTRTGGLQRKAVFLPCMGPVQNGSPAGNLFSDLNSVDAESSFVRRYTGVSAFCPSCTL